MKLQILIILLASNVSLAAENWGAQTTGPTSVPKKKSAKVTAPTTAPTNTASSTQTASSTPAVTPDEVKKDSQPTLKFSGFFDFRFTDLAARDNPNAAKPHAESGFGLDDGALYLNYENNKVSALIDLPFRRAKEVDLNSAATTPQQSTNGNFSLGVDKAQAYLKYKANSQLNVYVGQFDTIYGVELNDSKDRTFAKTGIVYDYTLPVTHSGAMFEFMKDGITYKLFAANPNNKGSFGTSTAGDENAEYGAAINYSNENYRIQVGHMQRAILKADGSDYGTRSLTDITFGATHGNLSADFEYAIISDDNKNTITAGDNTDKEKNGTGAFGLINYKLSEQNNLGLRYEIVKDDPAGLSLKEIQSSGVSLSHKLQSDLTLKLEVTTTNYENYTNQKWHDTRSIISALFNF
jgi:hypothetical protein